MIKVCAFLLFLVVLVGAKDPERLFIKGNNLFTSAIYKEMVKNGKGNTLVSPFSVGIILALAKMGAKGSTADELRAALRLPQDEEVQMAVKTLLPVLNSSEDYILRSANKMYVKSNYSVKEEFRRVASDVFYSDLESIDFSKSIDAAKIINEWVEKHTEEKIHDLMSPDVLDDSTRVVLVNALYFKAPWSTPFDTYRTTKADFYKDGHQVVKVDVMCELLTEYKFHENKELDAKFLELPFKNGNGSMTLILPNQMDGLEDLENHIDEVLLPQDFEWNTVAVIIPKFKIETSLDFKEILTQLGVRKAFQFGESDFSGISNDELTITDVRQKTFIDVNEGGVEAAAASFLRLVERSGKNFPRRNFIADHPFMFYIKVNDLVLFIGRVTEP